MPEAFITDKTPEVVTIDLGGEVDGMYFDGHVEIREGETFFNWTFEELQAEIATTITYNPSEEDDEN